MPQAHLTDLAIKALKADGPQTMYFDTAAGIPGFGVRVSEKTKTFCLIVGKRRQRLTLGRYPVIGLSDARAEAKRILAERTLGQHQPPSLSFAEAYQTFQTIHLATVAPRTAEDYRYILDKHFLPKLRDEDLGDITTETLAGITDKLVDRPSEHIHALAVGRTFFRWCVKRRYLRSSPLEGIEVPKAKSRDRALSEAEIKRVYKAAEKIGYPFGTIVQLLILLGQRPGEIAGLRSAWIDYKKRTITFPPEFTKNRRQHVLPFAKMAERLLKQCPEGDVLFPARGKPGRAFNGFSKSKAKLDATLKGIPPWTLHDLRRTFSTNLAALGVPQHVNDKLLNHVSGGSMSTVAAIYNRFQYADEMRDAVKRWERRLAALVR